MAYAPVAGRAGLPRPFPIRGRKPLAGRLRHEVPRALLLLLAVLLVASAGPVAAMLVAPKADVTGLSDHPVMGRMPGSLIAGGVRRDFARIGYPRELGGRRKEVTASGTAEGAAWNLVYWSPPDVGPDAATAVYRRNPEKLGFGIVLDEADPRGVSCKGIEQLAGGDFPPLSWPIHLLVGLGRLGGRETLVAAYAFTARTTWGKGQLALPAGGRIGCGG